MSNQTKNNNLNYSIDPAFKVNRLFVLSFKNENFLRIIHQVLKQKTSMY